MDFISSELTTSFGDLNQSNYGSFSFSWPLPLKSNKLDVSFKSYLKNTLDLSSQLSFSSLFTLVDTSRPFSHIYINSSGQISLGPVENAPLLERIYLGGANLRGYWSDEIGTEALSVSQWGGKSALSLQIDAMDPVTSLSNKFLVGLHFDAGAFEPSIGASRFYTSYGLVARYQFEDLGGITANFSTNKSGRNTFAVSIKLN